jgi:hypothetical protein
VNKLLQILVVEGQHLHPQVVDLQPQRLNQKVQSLVSGLVLGKITPVELKRMGLLGAGGKIMNWEVITKVQYLLILLPSAVLALEVIIIAQSKLMGLLSAGGVILLAKALFPLT